MTCITLRPVPVRKPGVFPAMLLLMLGLCAAPAGAASISVGAGLQDRDATPQDVSVSYQGAAPVADSIALGQGFSSFDIDPPSGLGHMVNHSQPYPYEPGVLRDTTANSVLVVDDTYHITGPITAPLLGSLVVHVKGQLTSNNYIDEFGHYAFSSLAYLESNLYPGLDSAGNVLNLRSAIFQADRSATGPNPTCAYAADICLIGGEVDIVATLPLFLDDSRRDFDLSVLLTSSSVLGGGARLGDPLTGELIRIELQLPAGLGYTADGGWFSHLAAVPEPSPAWLMAAGVLALALRRRRRQG